jgi:hypothetical protein
MSPSLVPWARPCKISTLHGDEHGYVSLDSQGLTVAMSGSHAAGLKATYIMGGHANFLHEDSYRLEGSHTRNYPHCLKHCLFETHETNIERVGCNGWGKINDDFFQICQHGNGNDCETHCQVIPISTLVGPKVTPTPQEAIQI